MTQSRHRVPKKRRVLIIFAVLIYGCTTENTENWAITTPAANATINFASTPVAVPVAGTASVNNSANNIAIIDPSNNQFLSTTAVVTSNSSGAWNGSVTLQSAPSETAPGGTKPTKVCTGQPKPSINGTNITKHTTQDISIPCDTSISSRIIPKHQRRATIRMALAL